MPATLRPGRSSSRPLVMYVGRPKAAAPAQPWRPPAPGPERRRGHANPAPVVADPGPAVPAARPASYAAVRAPARAVPGTANVDATEHPVPTRVPRPWRGDHGSVRISHYARSALYLKGIPPGPTDLHQTAHMRGAAAFSNEISNLPLER